MYPNIFKNKKAQTLVEVMVAIGITVVALIGIISIALSYLSLGGSTAERTTAMFLAREGIEVVWAIRSSQWLDPTKTWPYGLTNGNWIADSDATSFTDAGTSDITNCTPCKLWLTSGNQYTHTQSSNSATLFRRLIIISAGDDLGSVCPDTGDGCEKKARVTVYWTERNRSHQITLEERFTDWR